MTNPLLTMLQTEQAQLPPFTHIKPMHVEPAIDQILKDNRQQLNALLEQSVFNWENLVQPLEEMSDRLQRAWSPVSHMNSVMNSDELREAYNQCLPKLSEYSTELGQNEKLYQAYQSIADAASFSNLDIAQQKIITNALRDFHLSGVDLEKNKKQRFKEIKQQLSKLKTKFEENILDATHAWHKLIKHEKDLSGLPEFAVAMSKQAAEQKELDGWVFTLDAPSYMAVMMYADDRDLREEMYREFVTRASDQGSNAGEWDNSDNMQQILALRHELAELLSFSNYAELSLATKMAETTDDVLDFLNQLTEKCKSVAEQEYQELKDFVKSKYGMQDIEAWDIMYYSENLRQKKYAISQEELKPYFPEQRVLDGMFSVVNKIYGIQIKEIQGVETWHKAVRVFEICDIDNNVRGQFYLDLYAREKKRGGAWMDDCQGRVIHQNGQLQIPVAYLTCNLTPPIGDEPALFTHQEVITLFHEFGHGLHHMLTQVNYLSVSGINGVAWDAVELPSQFLENWCWEREALDLIAAHYQTQEPMPADLYERMHAAKNFQSSMQMVRQIEFSIFDLKIHAEYQTSQFKSDKGLDIQAVLDSVREKVAVIFPPAFNRFQHSFSHIFAGGYAAGYYSYKWAEVLSADAFSKFEERGIFNRQTGLEFLHAVLEQGGSKEPMELFKAFRGREPEISALLRHTGVAA
ncbi:Oligopeptidase A [hydrothermal vent metagenome]|uniref:oligopeptidase A n=1 Tax=hydrothermal vent metagenome TaxID=652676 RepID=A0A3B0ZYI3_9ZZZZ